LEHRSSWVSIPVSERNAYAGSTKQNDDSSQYGGLRNDAIIKVELTPGDSYAKTINTTAAEVGIKEAVITGMIRKNQIGTINFALVSDEVIHIDPVLNNLGTVPLSDIKSSEADLIGAGDNHYIPFSITGVKYGRTYDRKATGPNGISTVVAGDVYIGYVSNAIPYGQSPPTKLILPTYKLDTPSICWSGGSGAILTVTGAVDVQNAGSGSQDVVVNIYDEDVTIDTLLATSTFSVAHPDGVWNGVLIPYNTNVLGLYIDLDGDVKGPLGDSHENPAQIKQVLVRDGNNPDSDTINYPQDQ